MADFGFYTDTYLGSLIPEKQFGYCMARAADALTAIGRRCRVIGTEVERQMALCAMAESVYEARRRGGVVSATTGSVSVRYDGEKQLWRELWEKARIYLQVCRGVG